MLTLNTTPAHFNIEKVESIVAEWQESDPDWIYAADYDPSGKSAYARIIIHDEDGEFVGYVS